MAALDERDRSRWPARLAALLFSFYWAATCNLILEFLQVGGNLDRIFTHVLTDKLGLFLLGSTILWLALILLWSLAGRLWMAVAAFAVVSLLVGFANYKKMQIRVEPIYPSDFQFLGQPGFLKQMIAAQSLAMLLVAAVLLVVVVFLSTRMIRHLLPTLSGPIRVESAWTNWIARVSIVLLVAGGLAYTTQFNSPGNRVRDVYESANARWSFWFQKLNYQHNGFVAGLLYNMPTDPMARPPDYSRARVQAVVDKYSRVAAGHNGRAGSVLADHNVVLVLSEAFSDPTRLAGIDYERDPIPYTRRLMEQQPSGDMLAQLYGGGTANMEFELLTGMSVTQFRPQMQTPYQMLIPGQQDFPSVVGYARVHLMKPIAVHPYMTGMYKRETVYPTLGFDRFLGEDDLVEVEKIDDSDFVSDASAFDEVVRQLGSTEESALVNLVTMQNHVPQGDLYSEPLPIRGIKDQEVRNEAEGYGRGLMHTDEALMEFLDDLQALDEESLVVFYGDHLPGIWPSRVQDLNGPTAMRTTPFFFWSTGDLQGRSSYPLTSPVFFLPLLFEAADIEMPPYYALLLDLYDHLSALGPRHSFTPDGERVRMRDLPGETAAVLRDYRLVQYDLAVGNRYSQTGLFYPSADPVAQAR